MRPGNKVDIQLAQRAPEGTIKCRSADSIPPELLVKIEKHGELITFDDGSMLLSLPYTVSIVEAGQGIFGFHGQFTIATEDGVISESRLDGTNKFVFQVADGEWNSTLDIRFSSSEARSVMFGSEKGRDVNLIAFPRFHVVDGSCE